MLYGVVLCVLVCRIVHRIRYVFTNICIQYHMAACVPYYIMTFWKPWLGTILKTLYLVFSTYVWNNMSFSKCVWKTCLFQNDFEKYGPAPGSLTQKWQLGPARDPDRCHFWARDPGPGPYFQNNFEKDLFFQTHFENTRYSVFKMVPNQGFQNFMI